MAQQLRVRPEGLCATYNDLDQAKRRYGAEHRASAGEDIVVEQLVAERVDGPEWRVVHPQPEA